MYVLRATQLASVVPSTVWDDTSYTYVQPLFDWLPPQLRNLDIISEGKIINTSTFHYISNNIPLSASSCMIDLSGARTRALNNYGLEIPTHCQGSC